MTSTNDVIAEGYRNGDPLSVIADAVNLSTDQVSRRAKRMGIKHPMSNQMRSDKISGVIEAMGIDPKAVDHGWIKTEEASIHFRNDLPKVSIEDLLADGLERIKKHSPKYTPIKREKLKKHIY